MKTKLFFLLIFWNLGLVQGQVVFEYTDTTYNEENRYRVKAGAEIDDGYLLAGNFTLSRHTMIILKLSEDGGFMDSLQVVSDTFFYPKEIRETEDSYLLIGTASIDSTLEYYFWHAEYSKDLKLLSKTVILIENISALDLTSMKSDYITYTWDSSDTILFVYAGGTVGRIILSTNEIVTKFLGFFGATLIKERKGKSGYIVVGSDRMFLLDETFEKEKWLYNPPIKTDGFDLEYLTDSTILFASHFTSYDDTEYFDKKTRGVYVGIMTTDFDILTLDTMLHTYTNNTSFSNSRQKILEKSVDSTFIVAGQTFPYLGFRSHLFFSRYSSSGERLLRTTYIAPQHYLYGVNVMATSDGGCLIYGGREYLPYQHSVYVVKFGYDGVVTGETSIPVSTSTLEVYPNPTIDIIEFNIENMSNDMNFYLMDMQGHIVMHEQVNGQSKLSTAFLPRGVYAYRLSRKDGKVVKAGKLVKE